MQKKSKWLRQIAVTSALALTAGGIASSAIASDDDADPSAFIALTGFSLNDAILSAQTDIGGVAVGAELENENGVWIYEVETVLTDGSKMEATYDGESGVLIDSGIDVSSDDDADDQEDDDDLVSLSRMTAAETNAVVARATAKCETKTSRRKKNRCLRRHGLR